MLAVLGTPGDYSSLPAMIQPWLQAMPDRTALTVLVCAVVGTVLLKNVIAYHNALTFTRIDVDVGHSIRTGLFGSLMNAGSGYINSEPSGRVANALLTETWRVSSALGALFQLIIDICAVIVFATVLLFVSWSAALLAVPTLVTIGGVMYLVSRRAREVGAAAVEASTVYTSRAWDGLSGLRTVQIFGRGQFEVERLSAVSLDIRRHLFDAQRIGALIPTLFGFLVVASIGLGVVLLADAGAALPSIAVFLVVLYRMQPRVRSILSARAVLLELGNSILEIEEVQKSCKSSALISGTKHVSQHVESIRFANVAVQYNGGATPTDRSRIRDSPEPNNCDCGTIRCGKSTVINLLCRMLDPTAGRIEVNGVDLREYRLDEWHDHLALVSQDIFLFDAPIVENIRYGS